MKELSTEQKAKAYDKALERAKVFKEHLLEINDKGYADEMDYIFPELKESEDEKIRKFLIEDIKDTLSSEGFRNYNPEHTDKLKEALAWLEKQKVTDEEIIFRPVVGTDIRVAAKQALEKIDIGKKVVLAFNGAYIPVNGKTVGEIDSEYDAWLEKQGEQEEPQIYETEDGEIITYSESGGYKVVEPKFKVGDWVIDKQNIVHQIANVIENVTNHTYGYDTVSGGYFNDNTEGVRLWTIQDAKDGDVLVSKYNKLFIYNGNYDSFYIGSYCGISVDDRFNVAAQKCHWTENANIQPATKRQRDLLFQKMHESGYEWDAEKKELKLLIITNGGDFESENCEQNPAWSEEDEHRVKDTIYFLDTAKKHYASTVELDACIDWLKSLKYRTQTK